MGRNNGSPNVDQISSQSPTVINAVLGAETLKASLKLNYHPYAQGKIDSFGFSCIDGFPGVHLTGGIRGMAPLLEIWMQRVLSSLRGHSHGPHVNII